MDGEPGSESACLSSGVSVCARVCACECVTSCTKCLTREWSMLCLVVHSER